MSEQLPVQLPLYAEIDRLRAELAEAQKWRDRYGNQLSDATGQLEQNGFRIAELEAAYLTADAWRIEHKEQLAQAQKRIAELE